MSTQITAPPAPTLAAEQGAAITALSMLLAEYAELPPAYIRLHPGSGILLQLDNPADAEVWRQALGIDPQDIALKTATGIAWLQVDAEYRGVPLQLTGHGVQLTVEQAAVLQAAPDFPPRGGHKNLCAYAAGMSSDCTCAPVEAAVEVAA